ncbi:MAG: hypothetical protein ACYS67_14895 [Planctomycetota bacterium]|jgi:hypothetical protein
MYSFEPHQVGRVMDALCVVYAVGEVEQRGKIVSDAAAECNAYS